MAKYKRRITPQNHDDSWDSALRIAHADINNQLYHDCTKHDK